MGFQMSLKWEIGALGAVIFGAAVFMMIAEPLNSATVLERVDNFSELDYKAFDRNFKTNGTSCDVGLKRHGLCFTSSPLQKQIAKGQPLTSSIPIMAAEFPVLAAIPAKNKNLKLLRYGQTLVLMNEETKVIEDLINLDETNA